MSDQELKFALTGSDNGAKAVFNDVGASIATTAQRVDAAAKSVQNIAAKLDKAAASASSLSKPVLSAEMSMGSLGMGLESAAMKIPGLDAGVGGLTTAFQALSNPLVAIPGLFAGAAVAAGSLAMGNADLIEHLDILSITTGLTTQELYALRDVALGSGLELDSMAKAASKLETSIGKGTKELQGLGLTGSDTIEDMAKIADAFNAATTQSEKNAIATAAFGKSWQDLAPLLAMGGDAIRKLRTESGLSESDIAKYRKLDEAADQLAKSWRDIKFEVGNLAAGPMIELLKVTQQIISLAPKAAQLSAGTSPIGMAIAVATRTFGRFFQSAPTANLAGTAPIPPAPPGGISAAEQADLDAANKVAKEKAKRASDAAEKVRQSELKFQREMNYQMELLGMDADQKEIRRIQEKYALLREEHKKNAASLAAIDAAQMAETLDAQMKINFNKLAGERNNDGISADMPKGSTAEISRVYQFNSKSKSKKFDEPSLNEMIANAPDNMQKRWEEEYASTEKMKNDYLDYLVEMQSAMDGLADHIAGQFSTVVGPALMQAFTDPAEAISMLGDMAEQILADMAKMVIEVAAKWALLFLISKATSGGTSSPIGFSDFLMKSLGGHAEGTLSSPGGLRYLGENGGEAYQTPMGMRGIATFGLYQVPSGTRVEKAGSSNTSGEKHFHLHTTQSDPIQVGQQFRRIVREEVELYGVDSERERSNF